MALSTYTLILFPRPNIEDLNLLSSLLLFFGEGSSSTVAEDCDRESVDSDEEDGWDDWAEATDTEEPEDTECIQCLFCTETQSFAASIFNHCSKLHSFDFVKLRRDRRLDYYECLLLINFIWSEAMQGSPKPVESLEKVSSLADSVAGASTFREKKNFGIADDIYAVGLLFAYVIFISLSEPGSLDAPSLQRLLENTFRLDLSSARDYFLADDGWVQAVQFLDLDDGAGWQLLQALLNPNFRMRPTAEAVLNHRFMMGDILQGGGLWSYSLRLMRRVIGEMQENSSL